MAAAPASVKELMNILLHDSIRTFTLIIHSHCAPFPPTPTLLLNYECPGPPFLYIIIYLGDGTLKRSVRFCK